MSSDIWKEFEENQLSHSAAHYLMTVHELLESSGYARVTDIAKRLNITRGSCSISIKPLKKRGLIVEDENKFLKLSPEGMRLAVQVERNDELLEDFFRDVLGVDPEQAEIDACKLEHLLSIETSIRLATFMDFVQSDRKISKAFLRDARKHRAPCTHDEETCFICREVCLVGETT